MGWDACTLEPSALLRWMECHPGVAGYLQTVSAILAIVLAFYFWRRDKFDAAADIRGLRSHILISAKIVTRRCLYVRDVLESLDPSAPPTKAQRAISWVIGAIREALVEFIDAPIETPVGMDRWRASIEGSFKRLRPIAAELAKYEVAMDVINHGRAPEIYLTKELTQLLQRIEGELDWMTNIANGLADKTEMSWIFWLRNR